MFNQNKLLTAEEVGKVLTLKPSTILSWVNQKKIPFIKFGKGKSARVRFIPELLNSWIKDQAKLPEEKKNHKADELFNMGFSDPKPDKAFDHFSKTIRETL